MSIISLSYTAIISQYIIDIILAIMYIYSTNYFYNV